MIKAVVGFQFEGDSRIFDTLEAAEAAQIDKQLRDRYVELKEQIHSEFPEVMKYIMAGFDYENYWSSRISEFIKIRKALLKAQGYPDK